MKRPVRAIEGSVEASHGMPIGVSTLTSIKIPIEVRNQLRSAAKRAGLTQAGLIEFLLNRFADELFWNQMEETSGFDAHAVLAQDSNELDEGNTADEAGLGEEGSSSTDSKEQR